VELPDVRDREEIKRVRGKRRPLPSYKKDSDEVYDLGPYEEAENHSHHRILDCSGSIVVCPKTEHAYLHIVKVPNKRALNCRGCGAKLSGATGHGWGKPSESEIEE